ncbi:SusD/RagB family nutrient-binding outer membrane lipoprotein [Lutibacter sp.]|uniref:SusD/RagB family nutrient-binding outer membrane lipoprotein n=1 Tax=Lutibacter sp. TaxID=1925666 RepID=UPI002736ED7E|nr:SusD/RagB family nutrient-binding outer membrane lipoprotein [Lutibacter sp.]MDP3311839.1 SusD/RagB family nutrient-binding outer membrane lipoprotein [Lutibacter sp.]
MKIFRNLLLISALVFMTACETTELEILDNPNSVSAGLIDPDFLFHNVQLGFKNFIFNANDFGSQTTRMTHMYGPTYDNAFSSSAMNTVWSQAYATVLADIEALLPVAQQKQLYVHTAAAKLIKAYVYVTLVDMFGSVPYTEAIKGSENFNPKADDGKAIYQAMFKLIDEAIVDLGKTALANPKNDLFYNGNKNNWIAMANTLKIKMYNTVRLDASFNSAAAITALSTANIIDTRAEDFVFKYGANRSNPDTRHPFYTQHYETENGDYMSNYYLWTLVAEKGFQDPRAKFYFYRQDIDASNEDSFTLDCPGFTYPSHYAAKKSTYVPTIGVPYCTLDYNYPGKPYTTAMGYWGRDHGDNSGIPPDGTKRTVYGLYPGGGKYDIGDGKSTKTSGTVGAKGAGYTPLLLSSYTYFMLAENILTSNPALARTHIDTGIRRSFETVNAFAPLDAAAVAISATAITNYMNFVLAAYDSASATGKKEILMKEYYITLWGCGMEAYNNYRRTGLPSNMQPTREAISGPFYRSFLYPNDYVVLNNNSTQKTNTTQVFWDTNPAGFIN